MPSVLVHPFSNSEDSPAQSFELPAGEILYDGLEKQGVNLAHGCLAGSCGACCIEVLSDDNALSPIGHVEADTLSSLQHNYPDKKIRLACRMKILNDCVVKKLK